MSIKLRVTVLSGVDDGKEFVLTLGKHGQLRGDTWVLSVGRADDNAIWLRSDTFSSRWHGALMWREGRWWLEDKKSLNGSFMENPDDFFDDIRIEGTVEIDSQRMIRIGRTWLSLKMETL